MMWLPGKGHDEAHPKGRDQARGFSGNRDTMAAAELFWREIVVVRDTLPLEERCVP